MAAECLLRTLKVSFTFQQFKTLTQQAESLCQPGYRQKRRRQLSNQLISSEQNNPF